MALVLWVIGGVIIGLALLAYAGFLAARYFFVARYPDEIHFVSASDGWRIGVARHRPAGNGNVPAGEPVLLVHGIGANAKNFDLTDERSLARSLAAAGHDAWLVDLRGRGHSMRPRLFSGLRYDWCFDEYAEKDLPAAVGAVLRATGAERIHLVGFSIGALAAYAFATGTHRTARIASLVAIAGPASFKRTGVHVSGRLIRNLRWLRHRFMMRVLAPVSGYWHPSPIQIIHNPENLEGAVQRRAMVNLIANFARDELLQYGDWLLTDTFRSLDQRRDYREELGRLDVPTLFLAGPRDLLAPPDAVKDAYERVSATDKKFVIASRAQGFSANYGHFDLLLGAKAPEEIYPVVERWIREHARQAHAEPANEGDQPSV